jgi:hypothetical protein
VPVLVLWIGLVPVLWIGPVLVLVIGPVLVPVLWIGRVPVLVPVVPVPLIGLLLLPVWMAPSRWWRPSWPRWTPRAGRVPMPHHSWTGSPA